MLPAEKSKFTGNHEHTLDKQGRLTIPSAWRREFAEEAVFLAVPQQAGYIAVLPPAEVDKLHERVSQVPLSDEVAQQAIASFFSRTQSFSFDKQGRFVLAEHLKTHAGIGDDVMLIGAMSKFNIYSPSRWTEQEARNAASNADAMRRLGI